MLLKIAATPKGLRGGFLKALQTCTDLREWNDEDGAWLGMPLEDAAKTLDCTVGALRGALTKGADTEWEDGVGWARTSSPIVVTPGALKGLKAFAAEVAVAAALDPTGIQPAIVLGGTNKAVDVVCGERAIDAKRVQPTSDSEQRDGSGVAKIQRAGHRHFPEDVELGRCRGDMDVELDLELNDLGAASALTIRVDLSDVLVSFAAGKTVNEAMDQICDDHRDGPCRSRVAWLRDILQDEQ